MRNVPCPSCGTYQSGAPDVAFNCSACGIRIEASSSGTRPVFVLAVVGALVSAGVLVTQLIGLSTGSSADAPKPSGTKPSTRSSVDAGANAAADVETAPLTLVWHAQVHTATGDKPMAPGTPCTLTEVVVHGDKPNTWKLEGVTFECKGRILYDSSQPLQGAASTSDSLEELPVAGDRLAYQYTTKRQDIGARSGNRNQITLSTRDDSIDVVRDTAPDFHVKATVDMMTAPRRGRPLMDYNAPNFPDVVRRTAKMISHTGALPFPGNTCDLAISPAGSRDENCRVLLTCEGKVAFGGGHVGFEKCAMESGEPVSMVDPDPTPKDHDPELRVDLAAKTATLGDTLPSGAQYTANFVLSGP